MSTQVLPAFPGLTYPLPRTTEFATRKQVSISGKETALADMSNPRFTWTVGWSVLRQGAVNGTSWTEFSQLFGFYCQRAGGFDSFLYTDAFDYTVTDQSIGTGDGSTVAFQLVRAFGGFVQPVMAPNVITNVKVNGVTQTPTTDYTVSTWGSTTPGVVTFTSAPAASATITVTMTYYWPCRFVEDQCEFQQFDQVRVAVKKLSFKSLS